MCCGDWKSHGSEYYECSRYKSNPNITNESAGIQAREALKKYLFYFERVSDPCTPRILYDNQWPDFIPLPLLLFTPPSHPHRGISLKNENPGAAQGGGNFWATCSKRLIFFANVPIPEDFNLAYHCLHVRVQFPPLPNALRGPLDSL